MRTLVSTILALALGSCRAAVTEDFNSPDPAARNAAIVRAAADRDRRAVPDLIRMLDSDDAATRVLAIRALERLTGQSLGYDPCDTEPKRRQSVLAWRAWQQARSPGSTDHAADDRGAR